MALAAIARLARIVGVLPLGMRAETLDQSLKEQRQSIHSHLQDTVASYHSLLAEDLRAFANHLLLDAKV